MSVIACEDARNASPEAAPGRRIILLSGEWRAPGTAFALEATIFAGDEGRAEGDIFWINVDTPWAPPDLVGTELVSGAAKAMQLELKGYRADPTFALDHYVISLLGDGECGAFEGVSQAFGDWDGRLAGTYQIVTQRD